MSTANTSDAEPRFLIHQATHMYLTDPIHFQIVQMDNSYFVWVGKQDATLNDLSIAMPGKPIPPVTMVMGHDVGERSRNLARRLASKYGQQFYVSLNIGRQDDMLVAFVEKKLTMFIKSVLT